MLPRGKYPARRHKCANADKMNKGEITVKILTGKITKAEEKLKQILPTCYKDNKVRQLLLFQILNLILFAVAAIMSVVNIATKEKVLFWVTAVFAVLCLANLPLSRKGNIAKCFFFAETIALLSFFIVTGIPGGFSILWILIVPAAAMSVFGMRVGSFYSTVLFLDVIFFFWTPLGRNLLMYDYSDAYMLRFPFVYVCMYLVSFYLEWIRQKTMEYLIETEKKNRWLSRHDALTWAYNRHAFNEELDKILSGPSNKVIGTIMLDIDNFKRINDTYGHSVGDKVICRLSDLIVKNICEHCLFCRWGGEEFLIAMRCEHDPKAIAEVIRSDVEQNRMTLESGETISFTVSVGVSYCESADRNTFIDRVNDADKALYAAKNAGKNVVVVYDPNSM